MGIMNIIDGGAYDKEQGRICYDIQMKPQQFEELKAIAEKFNHSIYAIAVALSARTNDGVVKAKEKPEVIISSQMGNGKKFAVAENVYLAEFPSGLFIGFYDHKNPHNGEVEENTAVEFRLQKDEVGSFIDMLTRYFWEGKI